MKKILVALLLVLSTLLTLCSCEVINNVLNPQSTDPNALDNSADDNVFHGIVNKKEVD